MFVLDGGAYRFDCVQCCNKVVVTNSRLDLEIVNSKSGSPPPCDRKSLPILDAFETPWPGGRSDTRVSTRTFGLFWPGFGRPRASQPPIVSCRRINQKYFATFWLLLALRWRQLG
jgi:hypothetical protein